MRIKKVLFSIFIISQILNPALSQNKGKKSTQQLPAGFGKVKWGDLVSASKKQILGKLVYTDDKKLIISKDGNIEYRYGFFLPDPALAKMAKGAAAEGKLFFVTVRFPYLSLEDVQKKVEDKYGPPTVVSVSKNKGAVLWDAEKTTIILWVDEYEKKPYSMKITYLGKDIAKEINEYQKKVFNKNELEVIEKMTP